MGVGLLDDAWITKLHINFRDKAIPEARATKHSNGPHWGHWKRQMGCTCKGLSLDSNVQFEFKFRFPGFCIKNRVSVTDIEMVWGCLDCTHSVH